VKITEVALKRIMRWERYLVAEYLPQLAIASLEIAATATTVATKVPTPSPTATCGHTRTMPGNRQFVGFSRVNQEDVGENELDRENASLLWAFGVLR
jgi:hypothetical protein